MSDWISKSIRLDPSLRCALSRDTKDGWNLAIWRRRDDTDADDDAPEQMLAFAYAGGIERLPQFRLSRETQKHPLYELRIGGTYFDLPEHCWRQLHVWYQDLIDNDRAAA